MLKPLSTQLRTIHNGSRDVAKVQVVIPPGDELQVSEQVAAQLQRDGAFKDGPPSAELLSALEADEATERSKAAHPSMAPPQLTVVPPVEDDPVGDPAPKPKKRK